MSHCISIRYASCSRPFTAAHFFVLLHKVIWSDCAASSIFHRSPTQKFHWGGIIRLESTWYKLLGFLFCRCLKTILLYGSLLSSGQEGLRRVSLKVVSYKLANTGSVNMYCKSMQVIELLIYSKQILQSNNRILKHSTCLLTGDPGCPSLLSCLLIFVRSELNCLSLSCSRAWSSAFSSIAFWATRWVTLILRLTSRFCFESRSTCDCSYKNSHKIYCSRWSLPGPNHTAQNIFLLEEGCINYWKLYFWRQSLKKLSVWSYNSSRIASVLFKNMTMPIIWNTECDAVSIRNKSQTCNFIHVLLTLSTCTESWYWKAPLYSNKSATWCHTSTLTEIHWLVPHVCITELLITRLVYCALFY